MAWLSRMMQTDWKNWLAGHGANPAVYYRILQTFLNMDEEAAAEAALAALEVEKKWNSHDAETRALFKSNDSYQLFMRMAVMRLSQLDPKRALKIVEAGPPKNDLLETVIASGVLNPSVDIESLLGGPEDGNYERKLNASISGLALDQPQLALALLEKHPELDMERQRALLIDTLGSSKPEEAVALAAAMMKKADRSDALHRALGLWAEADKTKALEWAESYSGPGEADVKAFLLTREISGGGVSSASAMEAYSRLQQEGANGRALHSAAGALISRLAQDSPESARDWAVQLPAGGIKPLVVDSLMRVWLEKDSYNASQWARTLPAGPEKDTAARRIIHAVIQTEPASAYQWAGTLSTQEERAASRKEVLDQWKQQNPEAAQAAERADNNE
ncbi:MAG: hypothetical protein EOP50_06645 [Sphingobacteriales bacterium]|nr:MAG: hypothetical protein EOP50_06645 [Sphingobacteriales bacterium]